MQYRLTVTPYQFRIKLFLLILFVFMTCLFLYDEPYLNQYVNHFKLVNDNEFNKKQSIRKGLNILDYSFTLNDKPFTILSGSMHYFRIHPSYWFDRLLKLKSAGLNTVTTYIPWNLHQKCQSCLFDFKESLDIRNFLIMARDLGLYVILRPGPYICAEWEFGGLPSWLLTDPNMKVRSLQNEFYTSSVTRYLAALLEEVHDLQYSSNGSIIAWQVENELASYYKHEPDGHIKYLIWLKDLYRDLGISEFLFTSDGDALYTNGRAESSIKASQIYGAVNFQNNVAKALDALKKAQPKKPLFVAEFWAGWFDHWAQPHHTLDNKDFQGNLELILQHSASFNIYMFHGGTNFGFMNGANAESITPKHRYTVTSYDYDAAISEDGSLAAKYYIIRKLISDYSAMLSPQSVTLPLLPPPAIVQGFSYGTMNVESFLPLQSILATLKDSSINISSPCYIEDLIGQWKKHKMNNSVPSGLGYVLYRAHLSPIQKMASFMTVILSPTATITLNGQIRDRANLYWGNRLLDSLDDTNLTYGLQFVRNFYSDGLAKESSYLDLLVENMGRVNFNYYSNPIPDHLKLDNQRKGFAGSLTLDGHLIEDWSIIPLEFGEDWLKKLRRSDFKEFPPVISNLPALFRATFEIETESPADTFLDFTGWQKGCVFVNNFNIGRYWSVGPQKELYIPGPLLRKGKNEILIWETEKVGFSVSLNGQRSS